MMNTGPSPKAGATRSTGVDAAGGASTSSSLTERDQVLLFGVELGLFQAWQLDVCLRVMECDDGL